MDDTTTLLIIFKNEEINNPNPKTIERLLDFQKKHQCIKEIIFIDETRKMFMENLKLINTNYTITLESGLHTRFRQIEKQIKYLHRVHLVLPDRFHPDSKTSFNSNGERLRALIKDLSIRLFFGLKQEDVCNQNKAFRTKQIRPFLEKTISKNYWWVEALLMMRGRVAIRISEVPTHYIMERKEVNNGIKSFLFLMKEFFFIKKRIERKEF